MTASFYFYHNQFIQFLFTIIVYYKKIRFLDDIYFMISRLASIIYGMKSANGIFS